MSMTPDRGERRHDKEAAARQYPEHEKLRAVSEQSQVIGEFLDNCCFTLCEYSHELDEYCPVQYSIQEVLAKYFNIDLNKIEAEKRQMLETLRAANA